MKRVLWGMVVVAISAAVCFWFRGCDSDYANLPPTAAGFGARSGADFPSVLAAKLGVPIRNLGVPGETSAAGLARMAGVVARRPRVVLLGFGGNDALQGVAPAETFQNLATMIDQLHDSGSFVVLLGIRSGLVFDKYEKQFHALARRKRVLYVPDILAGLFADPRYMSDQVHPNEEGYQRIAERIAGKIVPLIERLN